MKISLSASVTGLDEDLAVLEKKFMGAMAAAMPALREDMADCLAEHVQGDVYEAFEPHEYVRRGAYGGLIDIEGNSFFDVRQNGVRMIYLPSGESEQVSPEDQLDGDALIGRIEQKNPEYDWTRKPGKRPFFSKFATEMIEDGRAERTLVEAMNRAAAGLDIAADGVSTVRDGDEGYTE